MKTKLYNISVISFTTYFSHACHNNDIKLYKRTSEQRPPIVVVLNSVHRIEMLSAFHWDDPCRNELIARVRITHHVTNEARATGFVPMTMKIP